MKWPAFMTELSKKSKDKSSTIEELKEIATRLNLLMFKKKL